ncbi:PIN domain-containing protein [Arsenicicoccus sp. oral taxon 190]|uniref:PIN domain-containing protein n=1 Tax=Arsenicicoccus sp. oral taxon 190 TaxID=1658671 RepID=UPI00067A0F8D|nr:PIN domain-containing protein [Arsenicicoccus sp. oral taxon 190]AKT50584.1 hypothetical protein ADJ73_03375 [Arsenicicoccus sp. oral taxon 190]
MSRYTALLDACVLVPVALADTLLRLAEHDLYRPLWSDRILDETTTAIERVHPELADGRARGRTAAMASAFPDALVTGWQALVNGISLPDPDDRHVVAAAVRGRADAIVTANVRDFPTSELNELGISVQPPDLFLLDQLDLAPTATIEALHRQASATRQPPITPEMLLRHLAACGVPELAAAARRQLWRHTSELPPA